jgi:flagellar motor switch protein FliG
VTQVGPDGPADPTPIEKSAMVIMALGEETAAEVVKLLSPPEIDRLSRAMTRMPSVPRESAAPVLREFVEIMGGNGPLGFGGEAYLRGVLEKALGADKAEQLLGRVAPTLRAPGIEAAKWHDPQDLAEMVKGEHPQIVATIAACLDPEQAQSLMGYLPDDLVMQVIPRLAGLDTLEPAAIEELSQSLEQLLAAESRPAKVAGGGVDAAAKILNRIGGDRAGSILSSIGAVDPALAEQLNERMFVFEDLYDVEDRSFQVLLRSVDQKLLIAALKGAPARFQDKVLRNISQRAGQALREEIEAQGPMRLAEINEARKEILTIAQTLEREGTVVLRAQADVVP